MRRLAESLLSALLPRRAVLLPVPVRREDWRGPRRDGRRF